jgi:hypothetical protein
MQVPEAHGPHSFRDRYMIWKYVEGNCYGIWSHGFLDACMDGWIEKLWGDIVFHALASAKVAT